MGRNIVLAVAACCWAVGPVPAVEKKTEGPAAGAQLTGSYRVVGGEKSGMKIAEDRLHAVTVRVTDNVITTFDRKQQEVYAATFELDTSKKPWKITMTATRAPAGGNGAKAQGLVEVNGDTVRLIYAPPGADAPTQFITAEGQQMFVLKKDNPARGARP